MRIPAASCPPALLHSGISPDQRLLRELLVSSCYPLSGERERQREGEGEREGKRAREGEREGGRGGERGKEGEGGREGRRERERGREGGRD